MNAITLTCDNCDARLTVSSAAPKIVTCPRCLYRLANPSGGQVEPAPAPMKVLPLESQASGDTKTTQTVLIVLAIILVLGAIMTVAAAGFSGAVFNFLIFHLLLAFVLIVIVWITRAQKRSKDVAASIERAPLPPVMDERGVISYRNPYLGEPTNMWAAVGGFLAAIAVCGLGFFILAATVDASGTNLTTTGQTHRAFYLLLVILMTVGFMTAAPILASRKGWKGFGTGATIGLSLGLLALGPCAFCYLLTLGS